MWINILIIAFIVYGFEITIKERAERRLAKQDDKTNINRAEVALTKAVNRIKVYEHH
ncbi:ATP synthase delta/epsilon chain alpha-helix domain-containing protein [Amedibacterium intestinale]|uniref:ATP synthase delta/epsilon chain alpha-helix domain-containing protein n=1 Tax=Amedibacterium intestinale TaxID=2583452 RepID=UPI000E551037|nr:ATP synthase delta/epsilon chain alpha-helix domain-containing protein [Amedibacterium intestinale]RHO16564.1 hypothetical protein DW220_12635 [Eubacterium sp. AM18-26]RHO25546.1 hypothetical protein DW212_07120 [Eubacterium sp. AM18-10LB-B]RHO29119.1 hypothetical protein DW208_08030 [Erysipelotrichaceae bacterium AM17-60]BBK61495.1 hypothetical protein A9CBEGH2_04350 [Amedibacterium intestinale]